MAMRVLSSRLTCLVTACSSSRSYAAAAAAAARQEPIGAAVASTATMAAADGDAAVTEAAKKEFFWMRDPKTGCWIPENHFQDVDAADLRAKDLSKKG